MVSKKFARTAGSLAALMLVSSLALEHRAATAADITGTASPRERGSPAPTPAAMQRVEVKGKTSLEDPNSGVSKRVVTRMELDAIASTNLLEALRRIPGVAVVSNGRASQISLNGLGGGYTTILVDGATVPPGFNLETVGTAQIERIEISRVATAEQSGQAIAGVLNIVMRKAQPSKVNEVRLVGSGSSQNGDYSAAYVRNDSAGRLSNVVSTQVRRFYFDNTTYRTRVTTDPSGDQREDIENLDHVSSLSGNLSGRANWKSTETSGLQIDYGGVFRRTDYDSLELNRTTNGSTRNSAPHSLDRSLRAKLTYSEKLAAGSSYDLRASMGWGGQTEGRTFLPLGGTPERRDADRSDHTTLIGGTWRMPTESFGKVSAGAESERSRRHDTTWLGDTQPTLIDTDGNVKATRDSAFVQSDFDLMARIPAYLGVRYERLALNSRFVQDGNSLQAHRSSSQWSPVFQAKYKFFGDAPGPSLRVAVRRAYKMPNQDELSLRRRYATVNSPLSPDETGDIHLRPESATIYELGIESPLQKWGSVSLNLSRKDIRDVIQRTLQLEGSRWLYAPRNLGDATADGVDIDLKVSLQKLSATLPKVDMRAGYGIYRSRLKSLPFEDNSLLQQLPWNANTTIDWQWSSLPVRISLAYSKFGAKLVRLDASRAVGTPSIENIELSATYTTAQWGVLRGGITNASAPTVGLSDYFFSGPTTVSQFSHYRRPAGVKVGWDFKF